MTVATTYSCISAPSNALALERCVKAKRSATKSSPIAVPANPPPTICAPRAKLGVTQEIRAARTSTAAIFGPVPTISICKQKGRASRGLFHCAIADFIFRSAAKFGKAPRRTRRRRSAAPLLLLGCRRACGLPAQVSGLIHRRFEEGIAVPERNAALADRHAAIG